MTRTWAALAASVVAVAVLIALIYSSRPLGTQAYNDHHGRLNHIESSAVGVAGILDQLQAARRSGSGAGNGIRPLQSRIGRDRELLATAIDGVAGVETHWHAYQSALDGFLTDSVAADTQLRAYERSLRILREEGPAAVQSLRGAGVGPDAQRFYTLLLKVIEFSQPGSRVEADELQRQVDALRNNDEALPTYLLDLTAAMDTVLAGRDPLDAKLTDLAQSRFPDAARALTVRLASGHEQLVRERENARLLVSIFSLLLFAGLGFLGVRLNNSYRELNDVNDQLKGANEDLERKVQERTKDVQRAYTDLQQSQVQLVQAEKMSSLGQLVAGISHEINTPLLYLQSNTTMNKETLVRIASFVDDCYVKMLPRLEPGEDKAQARKRFLTGLKELQHRLVSEEIRDDLQEVRDLIDDSLEGLEELTLLAQGLKDFSRLDRAPVDSFNINDGIERTLMIARNMIKTRIEVRKKLGDVPHISCAPSQINQVLLNIITNAAQSIEGEGTIDIVSEVRGDSVVVEITDSGSGIDPEIMSKIRDPFFTTKEVGSGTGLGLSIVDEILNKHSGRLEIESELGKGSVFTIYLPISRGKGGSGDDASDFDTGLNEFLETQAPALEPEGSFETEVELELPARRVAGITD